jgi:beta-glucosidase
VYRFSISWSRIIPIGGRGDPINQAGIDHYVKFVDDLLEAGIRPFITLFHWDLPEGLEQRYGGILNTAEFAADFEHYARVMFKAIPKCKDWITFNEPYCSAINGYNNGRFAPGRTSDRSKSPVGDSATEPWIAGHSLIIAHGRAVKVYREEFKPVNGGQIGITLNGDYAYPWDPEDPADVAAVERRIEFTIAWYADPIYFGKYPDSMRAQLGDRLPEFTPEELSLVKGSNDFWGMNHYTSKYVRHKTGTPAPEDCIGHLDTLVQSKNGDIIGPETQCDWLRPNPEGFRHLLGWISKRYDYPPIYVTENGTSVKGESDLPVEQIVNDEFRTKYFDDYIKAMVQAHVADGVKVRGYMAWSLLDNFEWADGYVTRFGTTYVDYNNGQKRYSKKSSKSLKPLFDSLIKKD